MSVREVEYKDGTKLRLRGNEYEGKIGVDQAGFDFDHAVTQHTLKELYPEDCGNLDLRHANIYKVHLTSNISSFDVTTYDAGTYIFIFEQDSTGTRTVTFSNKFYWVNGVGAPNFGFDGSGVINIVTFLCDGEKFYGNYLQDFVSS